jgi:branched-chain amino acid aminotransferase
MTIYLNGHFVQESEAKISVLDLGLLRGFGVFDYLRTYHGKPFHLKEHLERLSYSARQIGLHLPYALSEVEGIILQLLEKNGYPESSIKIVLTGGVSADQLLPEQKSSLIILVYPLKPFPESCYTQGIKVTTTMLARSIPASKTLQYTPAIIALQQAKAAGAQEALYLNAKGEILEATTSNFFAFKDGALYTPYSDEVLLGITREVVLKAAQGHFPLKIAPIPYAEVGAFEEAFITSSNKEIMPVVQIDGQLIGKGVVGPKTKRVMDLFASYTREKSWPNLSIPRHQ